MQITGNQLILLYVTLATAGAVAGWRNVRTQNQISSDGGKVNSVPTPQLFAVNAAPARDWAAQWVSADCPAKQEVLLRHWLTRDPKALLEFLRRMPPVSFLNQKGWENDALLAWGQRDPKAALLFCCMHSHEFDFSGLILQHCLAHDLEQGLALLADPLIRRQDLQMRGINHDWIKQNPGLVCQRLSQFPNDFYEVAFKIWLEKSPEEAMRFAQDYQGDPMEVGGVAFGFERAGEEVAKRNREREVWAFMVKLGEKDPVAATKWAVENLPPAGLENAVACLRQNILSDPFFANDPKITDEQLPALLENFTPVVWHLLADDRNGKGIPANFGKRVVAQAPEWILPYLVKNLPLNLEDLEAPEKLPSWFTSLPPDRAAAVIRLKETEASKPQEVKPF